MLLSGLMGGCETFSLNSLVHTWITFNFRIHHSVDFNEYSNRTDMPNRAKRLSGWVQILCNMTYGWLGIRLGLTHKSLGFQLMCKPVPWASGTLKMSIDAATLCSFPSVLTSDLSKNSEDSCTEETWSSCEQSQHLNEVLKVNRGWT